MLHALQNGSVETADVAGVLKNLLWLALAGDNNLADCAGFRLSGFDR